MSPRPFRLAAGALLLAAQAACGHGGGAFPARPAPESLAPGSPLRSETLGQADAWLRHYLMEGKPDSALRLLEPGARTAPRDPLLRELQRGLVLHHAGKWAESNAAFEWAEGEAERRWTRSLAQQAGAMLVNDAVVEYVPPPGELAMVPYYRMLNYMALGSADGTLVEARKANAYLSRLADDKAPCVGEGFVRYLTGLVYRGAGERNDALVSYRQAERSFDACAEAGAAAPAWLGTDLYRAALEAGVRPVADSAAARYRLSPAAAPGAEEAELVVFVEHGWVAHRAPGDIHVPIFPGDVEGVDDDDDRSVADAAARITARLAGNLSEQAYWGDAWDEHPANQLGDALEGAYILKLAWPVYRLEAAAAHGVRVRVDGAEADAPVAADVSATMFRRWESQRPGVLARMVGRGVAKYLATRELERKAEKEGGEVAGWLAARLGNLAGNALERADTRSWSLLPDRVSVARFTLPPGEHAVTLEVLGPDGAVARTLDLGTVTLAPRGTLVLNRRVWGEEAGDPARLAGPRAAAERQATR